MLPVFTAQNLHVKTVQVKIFTFSKTTNVLPASVSMNTELCLKPKYKLCIRFKSTVPIINVNKKYPMVNSKYITMTAI